MSKATIIIPVYNKEKYLKETLYTVDNQTEDDIEVIIIDDHSTDKSMDIITDFANSTNKQTKIIRNDKNEGVAYSRNLGIEESKTDYITFLDADDILEKDFMEVMLDKAKRFKTVDLIRGKVIPCIKDVGILSDGELFGYSENQIIKPKYEPSYIEEEIVSCSGRLYKKEFIKNLRFYESAFEDYEFFLDTILSCNSILYTNEADYGYRFIEDGKYKKSIRNVKNSCLDYFDIYERIIKRYHNINPDMKKAIRNKHLELCFSYMNIVLGTNMSEKDKLEFQKNYILYLNNQFDLSEDLLNFLNISNNQSTDSKILRQNIKQILMKY